MGKTILLLLVFFGAGYWVWSHTRSIHRFTENLNDGSITAEILARTAKSDPFALFSLRINTHDGKVVLNGKVKSEKEKNEIEKIARSVEDVTKVENRLLVADNSWPPFAFAEDLKITAELKKELIEEEGWAGFLLKVKTNQGRVTLKGKVPSREQAFLAGKLAYQIPGVKEVFNQIQVH